MWNELERFSYAPDEDKTFEAYYRRYEDNYINDCADWTDAKKCPTTSTKARNCGTQQVRWLYLTKKKSWELGFLETVKILSELFSSKTSLFHKRWKFLNLTKGDSDDHFGFISVVNKNCDDFKLGELSADNFKCLIFAQGLVSAKDAEIRRSFVEIREQTRSHNLKTGWRLSEDSECQKNLKNIEESGVAYVGNVKHRSQSYSLVKERKNFNTGRLLTTKKKTPPNACDRCGKVHWAKDCPSRIKNLKTAINSGIKAYSVETEK